jgi:hypothetical protein
MFGRAEFAGGGGEKDPHGRDHQEDLPTPHCSPGVRSALPYRAQSRYSRTVLRSLSRARVEGPESARCRRYQPLSRSTAAARISVIAKTCPEVTGRLSRTFVPAPPNAKSRATVSGTCRLPVVRRAGQPRPTHRKKFRVLGAVLRRKHVSEYRHGARAAI